MPDIPLLNPKSQGFYPQNFYWVSEFEGGRPALIGTPGHASYTDFSLPYPVRALKVVGNYLYAVIGNNFYRITDSSTNNLIGTLTGYTSGSCWIADNGSEIMVNDNGYGWLYDLSETTLTEITDADFPSGSALGLTAQDTYFIVCEADTNNFYHSNAGDGEKWDTLDVEAAMKRGDHNMCPISINNQLWIFGKKTYEVYYNAAGSPMAFSRIPGADGDFGTPSPNSVAILDQALVWLDQNRMFRRSYGYNSKVISTPRMHQILEGYSTVSDARAFSFAYRGNMFYACTFPTEQVTWLFNAATSISQTTFEAADLFWSYWASEDVKMHRANCYAYFNGSHIIGDFAEAKLYYLTGYDDDGEDVRAIHTFPWLDDGQQEIPNFSFEVKLKAGVGITGSSGTSGVDPQMMMQYSNDLGRTWSNERWVSMGKIGEFDVRAIWRRLGRTKRKGRLYRIIISEPVERVIYGAKIN